MDMFDKSTTSTFLIFFFFLLHLGMIENVCQTDTITNECGQSLSILTKSHRLAKNPSGNRCRTFRPGFLWTARFYLNPKRVWHGIPGKSFPTIPNIPDFLASLMISVVHCCLMIFINSNSSLIVIFVERDDMLVVDIIYDKLINELQYCC